MRKTIKLLALIEATTVTGPAKNLINFCQNARSPEWEAAGLPLIDTSIVTFQRAKGSVSSPLETGTSKQFQPADLDSFVHKARAGGVNVDILDERFRFDPNVIEQLKQLVARQGPDVIQTHMIKSHFLVKLSRLGRHYPWVAFHHGYTTTDLKMRFYNQLNRWSLPSATKVVTVCGPFADRLVREGVPRDRIVIRHNSIAPLAPIQASAGIDLRHKLGINENETIILSVGRFSQEKGHLDLIDAVGVLRQNHPGLPHKLLLVGEGPEQDRVRERTRQLNFDKDVIFVGQVPDVRPYYSTADLLVLPSHSEGSPNVLLEAMAWRLPVLATDVGGVSEIVEQNRTAVLVPPHDPDSMARALARLIDDSSLRNRLADASATRVVEHFSPQIYTQSLIKLYSELVTGKAEPNAQTRTPV